MWFTIAWLAGTGHAGTVIGDCINGFNAVVAPTYIPGPYGPINGFTSIQDAIDAANDGDTICVLTGSYAEQLSITKEVTVQGWLGACQTTLAPMDGLGGPVVSVEAPNVTFDGFTVDGGGIHSGVEIRTSGSTVLHDLIFTNTVGTRGISINATSGVTEATNVFCQDPVTATLPGGHIYVGPEAILNSSGGLTVEQGSAPGGGGLFLDAEASATLDQSTFQFNTATSTTLYDGGGAILLGPNAVLSMSGGTLSNNHSSAHGGAINAALSSSSTVELSGTTVSHNTAAYGGGLAMSWTMPSILDGVDFQSNSALWEGGAIWSEFSDRVSIVDSTFAFNDAVTVGGGV